MAVRVSGTSVYAVMDPDPGPIVSGASVYAAMDPDPGPIVSGVAVYARMTPETTSPGKFAICVISG